ncbi:MAG: dihydrolipoyl dehydrogenase, partial [Acidobacteriota bacterium]|nr:dihydrolipoyl dehydrogenase [Acidobacteriota bacterium]
MADAAFDCIVVGAGPGGYVAAIRAAQLGMRTAVVERDKVGGRCLNYACIPAKAVLRSADLLGEVREAAEYGLRIAGAEVDYQAVQARREKIVTTLTGGVAGLFKRNGIELIEGAATLAGATPARVEVAGRELEARIVVLATGSVPRSLPGMALEGRVIGTEQAWALTELPTRLAVLGAGASGAEIASGFARLGSEVLLLEALDRLLPSEDADVSRLVERGFRQQGVKVFTSTLVEDVQAGDDGVAFSHGGETERVDFLVIATGRAPDLDALGLERAGVQTDEHGFVRVDAAQRTTAPGIYAIGDLVPGPALAHKASDEGILAVEDAAGRPTRPIAHGDIPRATFCTPNVGSFGLTEAQARERGNDVVVGKVPYGAVGGGTVYGDRGGLVKVVGDARYGELLGAHIVGSRATELIQEVVNVRALEGGYPELARI